MYRFTPAILAMAMAALPALAQTDINSITVTATRNTALQADQVAFSVSVSSGLSVNFNDVLAAVQSLGLTQTDLTGLNSSYYLSSTGGASSDNTLQWTFALSVPFSKQKDTVTALTNLQSTISQGSSGLTLSFTIQGTQVSQQLQQSQACSFADLIADARTQAQKLATAANASLGVILAISGSASSTSGTNGVAYSGSYLSTSGYYVSTTPSCSLTVRFAMSRS